jgi:hypothetical protein
VFKDSYRGNIYVKSSILRSLPKQVIPPLFYGFHDALSGVFSYIIVTVIPLLK